jgi:hypothetical protein
MKYILDMRDYVTRLDSELKDMNECFYRYNIVDDINNILATVWFTQMEDTGNIYSVCCRLESEKLKDFSLSINVPIDGPYRPNNYDIKIKNTYVNEENFYKIQTGLEMTRNIAHCIMNIFGNEEHIRWGKAR